MNRHISEQYDAELDSARSLLLEMGGLVEQQLQHACQALYNHDLELADKVRAGDATINQLEVDIDNLIDGVACFVPGFDAYYDVLTIPRIDDLRTCDGYPGTHAHRSHG